MTTRHTKTLGIAFALFAVAVGAAWLWDDESPPCSAYSVDTTPPTCPTLEFGVSILEQLESIQAIEQASLSPSVPHVTEHPLKAELLWRHPLLNPADRAPCKADRDGLSHLLARVVRPWQRLDQHLAAVKLEEMAAIARMGTVEPVQANTSATSDGEVRRTAARIARSQAELGIGETIESIEARLRGQGRLDRPSSSCVRVDGTFYLHSSFHDLPRTREAQELMRAVSTQAAAIIVAWFVNHGYTRWNPDLAAALARI